MKICGDLRRLSASAAPDPPLVVPEEAHVVLRGTPAKFSEADTPPVIRAGKSRASPFRSCRRTARSPQLSFAQFEQLLRIRLHWRTPWRSSRRGSLHPVPLLNAYPPARPLADPRLLS